MKKYLYISLVLLISTSLSFCGGSGGDDPTPPIPTPNNKPSIPSLASPTDNQLCIDVTVSFQWNAATDPDGDLIKYELQLATDNQFTQNVNNELNITTNSIQLALEKGVAYYWRVKAIDSKGATSSYSSTFSFYTEGDGVSNHLPFSPSIVAPNLNEVVQTTAVTLQWDAIDVDNDPLTFDVYFDTVNPPITIVSENQTTKTFDVALESSKNYYWKVVVKDDKVGVTIGPIWGFKTD